MHPMSDDHTAHDMQSSNCAHPLKSLLNMASTSHTQDKTCMQLLNRIIRLSNGSLRMWYASCSSIRVAEMENEGQHHDSQAKQNKDPLDISRHGLQHDSQ